MLTFFDPHGDAWITCDASHAEAVAFGPSGTARKLSPTMLLTDDNGVVELARTPSMTAEDAGAVVHGDDGDFDTLKPGWRFAERRTPPATRPPHGGSRDGAGRPPVLGERKGDVRLSLTPTARTRLGAEAERRGVSVSALVEEWSRTLAR